MKKLVVGLVLLVVAGLNLGMAAPAGATGTIAVCVTDSTGANVPLTGIYEQAWVQTGSLAFVGPVGPSGCRESTLPTGTNVKVYAGTQQTFSSYQEGVVPDGTTLRFDFYTTNVTLQYSNQVAYGGPYGDGTWFKQTPATASKELLSNGQHPTSSNPGPTPVRFRLSGTGGAYGRLGLQWPAASGTGATYTSSLIALRLVDSAGVALNGGTARYQDVYWYFAPGATGSEPASATTYADGILAYAVPGLAGIVTNEMNYNNTTQTVTQDASINSVYQFRTRKLTLRMETCAGVPLDGGRARYGIGSTYTTWWFPGGNGYTGTSAAGETEAQIFPGTYSFEMQYEATSDAKLSVVVPDSDSTLTWQTTNVTIDYPGSVSYGGPVGDSTWFKQTSAPASVELLPGTYTFHFRDIGAVPGATIDLTFSGCGFTAPALGSVTIVKDATPDDPQDFGFSGDDPIGSFSLDDDADVTLPDEETFTVEPGSYTVQEVLPAGWDLTAIECVTADTSDTSVVDLDTELVTIDVDEGESITCTFTNELELAVPTCNGLDATIVAEPGQSYLKGTNGNDVIVALSGPIRIYSQHGNDTICTGDSADKVVGGAGDDWIDAGGGNNFIDGGHGDDTITTGAGNDIVIAGSGNDTVDAGDGRNWILGERGNDDLTTGSGDDRVNGGHGTDTCEPGTGADTVRSCETVT